MSRCLMLLGIAFAGWPALATAEPLDAARENPDDAVRKAIERALPLLEQGAAGSADQRTCFTCHNQALPILALAEARQRGFTVDQQNLDRQLLHTWKHLERGREAYLAGNGQGGQVITAGYALWALEAGGHDRDDVTSAVTAYLLQYQNDKDHWSHPGKRPPSSGSDFTTTYVALRGLAAFGTDEQQETINQRTATIKYWLLAQPSAETEDMVFRLWSLDYVADDELARKLTNELVAQQREDGGWAQRDDMDSDAYASGSVLTVLLQAQRLSPRHPAILRGIRYLLQTQGDDGSWHVVTRAEPFQTYYESGFPHGKDQFISMSASSWAALALLLTLDDRAAATADE
jgi:hypothetical protein